MSRSAGPGSPIRFMCPRGRRRVKFAPAHPTELTGLWRRKPAQRGHALGVRSSYFAVQYKCTLCGHVGWSNHVDLVRRAVLAGVLPKVEAETDHKLKGAIE